MENISLLNSGWNGELKIGFGDYKKLTVKENRYYKNIVQN